jgi:hypothetical protein
MNVDTRKLEENTEQSSNNKLEEKINSLQNQIISKYKVPYSRLIELATFSAEK